MMPTISGTRSRISTRRSRQRRNRPAGTGRAAARSTNRDGMADVGQGGAVTAIGDVQADADISSPFVRLRAFVFVCSSQFIPIRQEAQMAKHGIGGGNGNGFLL